MNLAKPARVQQIGFRMSGAWRTRTSKPHELETGNAHIGGRG
jgi:hypothetical protein